MPLAYQTTSIDNNTVKTTLTVEAVGISFRSRWCGKVPCFHIFALRGLGAEAETQRLKFSSGEDRTLVLVPVARILDCTFQLLFVVMVCLGMEFWAHGIHTRV